MENEDIYNSFVTAIMGYERPKYKPINTGDIVRLKTGQAPMRVLHRQSRNHSSLGTISVYLKCEYLSSRKIIDWRSEEDFVAYTDSEKIETEKEITVTHKLYKTVDGKRYGEYRAKDGDKVLLLMSDSGSYEAFAPEAIKRVMPYTYDVMFSGTGKTYSYVGTEGEVVVGDLLLGDSMTVARVVAVGTESESATKRFVGVKLVTAPLGV